MKCIEAVIQMQRAMLFQSIKKVILRENVQQKPKNTSFARSEISRAGNFGRSFSTSFGDGSLILEELDL